jgi:hypothetical protein
MIVLSLVSAPMTPVRHQPLFPSASVFGGSGASQLAWAFAQESLLLAVLGLVLLRIFREHQWKRNHARHCTVQLRTRNVTRHASTAQTKKKQAPPSPLKTNNRTRLPHASKAHDNTHPASRPRTIFLARPQVKGHLAVSAQLNKDGEEVYEDGVLSV